MEKVITFKSKNGKNLYGIIHVPKNNVMNGEKIGINLLNPGVKYRVAPNRLNIKIARKLCDLGYYVFRFDPSGIGDSEGELPEDVLVTDIWENVQTGLLVSDTIMSNQIFSEVCNLKKIFMIGNCGGAITALLSAEKDSKIEGMCLIDIPVNLRTSDMTFADKVLEGGEKADSLFYGYIKRILNPVAWYNFLTFKTDYKALRRILLLKFKNIFYLNKKKINPAGLQKFFIEKNLNPFFFNSFDKVMQRNQSILFVVAGNDPGTEIFQTYFENWYLEEFFSQYRNSNLLDIFKIEQANHVYTLYEWQELLIQKICNWINDVNNMNN
jgi:hypothetical protein